MSTKVKGEAIKKNSIPISALGKEIYNKIINVLDFDDEYNVDYNNNHPDKNTYYLVTSYGNHIDNFKNYIYNLVNYNAMGGIKFKRPQGTYSNYMPFMFFSAPRELLLKIYDNDFSNIDIDIECTWGIALDDNNGSYYNVSIILNPKENKMYIKTLEI